MRQIGTIADEADARHFADYLLTQGITTRLDPPGPSGSTLWVHKEDLLPRARHELDAFQADPRNPRYSNAGTQAAEIRRQMAALDRKHARNTVDLRGRLGNSVALSGPVTQSLFWICVAVFVFHWLDFGGYGDKLFDLLLFSRWTFVDRQWVSDGLGAIRSGQVWRLVTPIFIHYGLLHIFFNMSMFLRFGRAIEARRGLLIYASLILFCAVVSNFAEFAFPDAFLFPGQRHGAGAFGGMSGVLYGLFGYVWARSHLVPNSGMSLSQDSIVIMLIWLVVCAMGLIGSVANTAHVAGLAAGAIFAFIEAQPRYRF